MASRLYSLYSEISFPAKDIKIDFGKEGKYEIYVVDDEKDGELVGVTDKLEFTIKKHSFVLIKEV